MRKKLTIVDGKASTSYAEQSARETKPIGVRPTLISQRDPTNQRQASIDLPERPNQSTSGLHYPPERPDQ